MKTLLSDITPCSLAYTNSFSWYNLKELLQ